MLEVSLALGISFDNVILLSVSFGGICAVADGLNDARIFFERSSRRDFSSNSGGVSQSFLSSGFSSSSRGILCIRESKSISFQKLGGFSSSSMDITVLNVSSNTTWYCGEILPVYKFKTKGTSLECLGLNPTNTPLRERGCHLGNFFPCWSVG